MKKFTLITASTIFAFSAVGSASALESGAFYVKPMVGYSMGNIDINAKTKTAEGSAAAKDTEIKLKSKNAKGLRAGIGFGYNISEDIRTELTFIADNIESKSKKDAKVSNDTKTVATLEGKNKIQSYNLMLSGYYHFMSGNTVSPYIGAGVGVGRSNYTLKEVKATDNKNKDAGKDLFKTKNATKFIYRAALGMDVALAKNIILDVNYGIGNMGESFTKKGEEISVPGTTIQKAATVGSKVNLVHGIEAGVRFSF